MKQFFLGILNGFGEIWCHKLRSMLTIVCVMLGVASLVLITGLVTGLFVFWHVYQQEYSDILKLNIQETNVPERQKHLAGMSEGETMRDAEAITHLALYAHDVAPEMRASYPIQRRKASFFGQLIGANAGVLATRKYEIAEGRFLSDLDQVNADPVIVLGTAVVDQLYRPNEPVVGTRVFINDQPFTVVGVLKHYEVKDGSYNILERKNQVAFIPLTAVQRRLNGSRRLSALTVFADSYSHLQMLKWELTNILMQTHRGLRDFEVYTNEENSEFLTKMETSFYLVGSGIGLITLLVGGIGITNLMLASINERIREIGIRKALGAWNRDVFVQFLAESVALSSLGGGGGVLLGVGAIRMMQHLMKGNDAGVSPPVLSTTSIVVGLLFSVVVGIIAGLYPAFRASRLDPIEALRYE